jgi:hypothetical protein
MKWIFLLPVPFFQLCRVEYGCRDVLVVVDDVLKEDDVERSLDQGEGRSEANEGSDGAVAIVKKL